ncbi:MAG: hypothetical protein ACLUNV_08770, partial [Sutterella wadsworthensis]
GRSRRASLSTSFTSRKALASLSSTFEAMKTGKPYPVRALIMTGCAMFHREPNSARLIEGLQVARADRLAGPDADRIERLGRLRAPVDLLP